MRIPVVRDGDPTTTGGQVHATRKGISDDGKTIALHDDRATCGNCEGTWPIVGTGYRMSNNGIPVVLQGDNVLCPCEKNRAIAGPDAKCFYHRLPGENEARPTTENAATPTPLALIYDEQFLLHGGDGQALADTYYTLRLSDGSLIHGSTDASGRTARHATSDARTVAVYLGHREE